MELIADPLAFVDSLGGLHDAYIVSIEHSAAQRTLTLGIGDLNACLRNWGTTDEPDVRPAALHFTEVGNLEFGLQFAEGIRIDDMAFVPHAGGYDLALALNLGGLPSIAERWWIRATLAAVYLVEHST